MELDEAQGKAFLLPSEDGQDDFEYVGRPNKRPHYFLRGNYFYVIAHILIVVAHLFALQLWWAGKPTVTTTYRNELGE
jgi:hypothetical protein